MAAIVIKLENIFLDQFSFNDRPQKIWPGHAKFLSGQWPLTDPYLLSLIKIDNFSKNKFNIT